jgi:hypothetical protein
MTSYIKSNGYLGGSDGEQPAGEEAEMKLLQIIELIR